MKVNDNHARGNLTRMGSQEELTRDVYAYFGLAYYLSECVHSGLCIYYTLASFEKPEDGTRPRVEEKLALASSLTLGQLVVQTKGLLPSALHEQLEVVIDKRNYLAHHFWSERIGLMFCEQGLLRLSQELIELGDFFREVDQEVKERLESMCSDMGIPDELMEEARDRLLAGAPEEPLINQRKPGKRERVVRAWDVRMDGGGTAHVFETEDGCLWQFCDVGLGWTLFDTPAPNWVINENVQKYLPAIISSRPPIAEPWNYEFGLGKGAVLWVKRDAGEKGYRMGIRTSQKGPMSRPR